MIFYTGNGQMISFGSSVATGQKTATPWDTVIHRGWIAGTKENTLPAMFLTKENGYDWAECDIRLSQDNVPVLAHDNTVKSEDGSVTLTVPACTAEQLQSITLQTHSRFGEIKVATLKEVLDLARLIGLNLLLDIKNSTGTWDAPGNRIIAQTVLESGWADHVVYMPLSVETAAAILEVDHNASFDFVKSFETVASLPDLAPYQALLTGGNTVGFDMSAATLSAEEFPQVAQAIRAAGLNLSFWNISASTATAAMDAGPLRITKHNGSDKTDLDAPYLASKIIW